LAFNSRSHFLASSSVAQASVRIFNSAKMIKNKFALGLVVSVTAAEWLWQTGCHALSYMTAHSIEHQLHAVAKLVTAGAEGGS
jgi:hypothetical protein